MRIATRLSDTTFSLPLACTEEGYGGTFIVYAGPDPVQDSEHIKTTFDDPEQAWRQLSILTLNLEYTTNPPYSENKVDWALYTDGVKVKEAFQDIITFNNEAYIFPVERGNSSFHVSWPEWKIGERVVLGWDAEEFEFDFTIGQPPATNPTKPHNIVHNFRAGYVSCTCGENLAAEVANFTYGPYCGFGSWEWQSSHPQPYGGTAEHCPIHPYLQLDFDWLKGPALPPHDGHYGPDPYGYWWAALYGNAGTAYYPVGYDPNNPDGSYIGGTHAGGPRSGHATYRIADTWGEQEEPYPALGVNQCGWGAVWMGSYGETDMTISNIVVKRTA
jgi:hypothetical protein